MRPISSCMSSHQLSQIIGSDMGDRFPPMSSFIDLAENHLKCLLPKSQNSKFYYKYLIKFFKTFCLVNGGNLLNLEEDLLLPRLNDDGKDDLEEQISFEQRKMSRNRLGIVSNTQDDSDEDDDNDDTEDWNDNETSLFGGVIMTGSNAGNDYTDNGAFTNDEDDQEKDETTFL